MLNHGDRVKANLYSEWSVALKRLYAVKFRLRRERTDRIKRTKKREPHIGNKKPIFVDHVAYQERCLNRLMDALGLARHDIRGLDTVLNQKPTLPWVEQGSTEANRRMADDKRSGQCSCHLCGERIGDHRWLSGR